MPTTYLGSVTVVDLLRPSGIPDALAVISASINLLVDFKVAIRIIGLIDLEAQLSASLSISLGIGLSIGDPALYIAGLLQGVLQVIANINLLIPSITLSLQLSASLAISIELEAKIAAFDLVLDGLDSIVASLQIAASISISVAGGVYAYEYDGPLSGMGTSLDSTVSVTSGLAPGTSVHAIVYVIDAGNVLAIEGIGALLLGG